MSKFTPGPWHAEEVQPETHEPSIWRVHAEDDSVEASICFLEGGEHDNDACARLISTAPDLYEALRELVDAASAPHPDWPRFVQAMTTKARAALAKAEGKS
jgi:hypothetical protein